jgi:hypothetical protein
MSLATPLRLWTLSKKLYCKAKTALSSALPRSQSESRMPESGTSDSMMITAEQIRDHIPKYLTPQKQGELVEQLRNFENRSYYTTLYPDDILQGDGWSSIQIIRFDDGARDKIKGILLTNSCDIDVSNPRDLAPRIVFAPLIRLADYEEALKRRTTLKPQQIDAKVDAIRKQRVSSLFFLPRGAGLDADHMAILDDLHSIPLNSFREEIGRLKLFTLGQMGFYLFLLKLSIHFCRFQEGISRS